MSALPFVPGNFVQEKPPVYGLVLGNVTSVTAHNVTRIFYNAFSQICTLLHVTLTVYYALSLSLFPVMSVTGRKSLPSCP